MTSNINESAICLSYVEFAYMSASTSPSPFLRAIALGGCHPSAAARSNAPGHRAHLWPPRPLRDRTGKEQCGDLEWKVTYELEADDAWTAGPLLEALPDFGMLPAGALG